MADTPAPADDAPRRKAGYKSWKKKYRKMRIAFEHKMHEGEDIFKQEAKAAATVKRIAVENEYVPFALSINCSLSLMLMIPSAGYWTSC